MKLRALLMASTALLVATLALATPASASEELPAPSNEVTSVTFLEVATGKVLGQLVPAQWGSVVEMEVKTGNILQRTTCDDWQDAETPDACVGEIVVHAPLLPADLAGLLGLI